MTTDFAPARAALDEGDFRAAWRALWPTLRDPLADDPEAVREVVALLAGIGRLAEDQELVDLLGACDSVASGSQPGNAADVLLAAADALNERGLTFAAALLALRALRLEPGPRALFARVDLLGDLGRYGDARALLVDRRTDWEPTFFGHYLAALDAVLAGDAEAARAEPLHPGSAEERLLADRVRSMVARYDAVRGATPLDDRDLRGWQFVITGTVLLHRSPFGFDEGMNGRYAFTTDSHERIRMGLERLHAVLAGTGVRMVGVGSPSDRESRALALAASELLGLPIGPPDRRDRLMVVYDPGRVPGPERERVAGFPGPQWVHAVDWVLGPPFSPDYATLLAQTHVAPWDERMRVDHQTGEVGRIPADDAPAEVLARRILDATASDEHLPDDDVEGLVRFARVAGPVRRRLPRERFWYQGPVRSSRFV